MPLDPVSSLILDEADPLDGPLLVIDDPALTRHLAASGACVRAWCDDRRDADTLPSGVLLETLDAAPAGATVLLRLPKAISALEEYAETLAATGASRIVAGGRVKHMTRSQNEALARSFAEVKASLGRHKSRVLHASGPRPDCAVGAPRRWPAHQRHEGLGLTVWAHGSTFNTVRVDAGTRLLIGTLRKAGLLGTQARSERGRALDLGCGSGILATLLARAGWDVEASDVSWGAVDSTRLTAAANHVTLEALWRDGLGPGPYDLVVTNPPFHVGAAKDSTPTLDMIADAAGKVTGEFWCVFNSHLPYLRALQDALGPTAIVARDRAYTVTCTTVS